ncbi:MAG: hypothetical protein JWM93_3505 [Frankiales bacterium]|nr:hypothetical protein [Frankiales bacterium]
MKSAVSARTAIAYSYAASGVPRGAHLALQRQMGTAHAWRTVNNLASRSGSSSTPGLPLGRYMFRVAVLDAANHVLAAKSRVVLSYGTVSYAALCRATFGSCGTGAYAVGTHVFAAEDVFWDNSVALTTQRRFGPTSCRSATLSIAIPNEAAHSVSDGTDTLALLQQTLDVQSADVAVNSVATLHTRLDGAAWELDTSTTGYSHYLIVKGTLSCYTATGLR